MASANVVELNDENFSREVLGDGVALVDFWSDTCVPCRMLAPTIDQIADDYAGRAKVCKFDVSASQGVPIKFGIQLIPTIILFKGGERVKQFVGMQSKKDLKAALDALLA